MFRLILLWYGLLSVSTFIAYWFDKRAAIKGRHRIRERTLHLLALSGGFPGALTGMRLLRHKGRKRAFLAITWTITLLHVAGWSLAAWKGLAAH